MKSNVKVNLKNVQVNKIEKTEKTTYLKEGLTGKQLQAEKLKANSDNKAELKSFSFQQKQFFKYGNELLKYFKKAPKFKSQSEFDKIFSPNVLLPFLSEKEKERINSAKLEGKNENFSFYLFENLVIRYLKSL